jgi:hypothetical protein
MRNVSVFGELIILIVYIQFLHCVVLREKCFTYGANNSFCINRRFYFVVNLRSMMTALFLSKNTAPKKTF